MSLTINAQIFEHMKSNVLLHTPSVACVLLVTDAPSQHYPPHKRYIYVGNIIRAEYTYVYNHKQLSSALAASNYYITTGYSCLVLDSIHQSNCTDIKYALEALHT